MRQVAKQARPRKRESGEITEAEAREIRNQELEEEIDDLLDEIDEVLEENAEIFVREYVQRGGQ